MSTKQGLAPGPSLPLHTWGSGSVAVTYYDFRNNDSSPGVPTDAWIVRCASNCASAGSWSDEARLSPTSFDIEQAPAARGPFGYFLGEYEGLANVGNSFERCNPGSSRGVDCGRHSRLRRACRKSGRDYRRCRRYWNFSA